MGKIAYLSLAPLEGGRLSFDRVKGALSGTPDLSVTEWQHADAAPAFDGLTFAARAEGKQGQDVIVILPEVILNGNERGVLVSGGFFPSRFSRSWSYTTYTLPASPGRSGFAMFFLRDVGVAGWIPRPKGSTAPDKGEVLLSSSQTSAEPSPRVKALVFAEPRDR